MKKAEPTIVGEISCGVCNAVAEVRQRSTGKKLLYTYCPNCKADQRTGKQIQAFWAENMQSVGTIGTRQPEPAPEPITENAPETDTGDDIPEWEPEQPKAEEKPEDSDSRGSGWVVGGLIAAVLLAFGIKAGSQQ
ncbi:hypothetical protein [Shewanella gelidii]|uniref:Uncharacterized protein n=1 Tax=Shewanella gelidii TaxID=1642821 RepID=A0A917ND19_9GAMM|nr:hypothetical protein [Shewanella gelidii]MCL1098065.1 hypothetical protein [Shewanella gelidii]GGI85888.1 hypothetical protein GCM10009332_23980 [Shewanella gelidii]